MALNERQAQAQLYLHALEEEAKASLSMIIDYFNAVEQLYKLEINKIIPKLKTDARWATVPRANKAPSKISVYKLLRGLPIHILGCLVTKQPTPGSPHLSSLTDAPLRSINCYEHVNKAFILLCTLSEMCVELPPLRENGTLGPDPEFTSELIDAVIMALLTIAGPESDTLIRSSTETHTFSQALCRAEIVPAALRALSLITSAHAAPERGNLNSHFNWNAACEAMFTHPRGATIIDAVFEASRVLIKGVRVALCSPSIGGDEVYALAYAAGGAVELVTGFTSAPLFYHRMMLHDPQGSGPLRLILACLAIHDEPLAAPPFSRVNRTPGSSRPVLAAKQPPYPTHKGKGAAELLAARGFALLLLLGEYDVPMYLDEVFSSEGTKSLAEQLVGRSAAYVGQVLLRPPSVQFPPATSEGQMAINVLRAAELLSDDSNFRVALIPGLAPTLAQLLAHSDASTFASMWCLGEEAVSMMGLDSQLLVNSVSKKALEAVDKYAAASKEYHAKGLGMGSRQVAGLLPELHKMGRHLALERSILLSKLLVNLHYYDDSLPVGLKNAFLDALVSSILAAERDPAAQEVIMQRAAVNMENLFAVSWEFGPPDALKKIELMAEVDMDQSKDLLEKMKNKVAEIKLNQGMSLREPSSTIVAEKKASGNPPTGPDVGMRNVLAAASKNPPGLRLGDLPPSSTQAPGATEAGASRPLPTNVPSHPAKTTDPIPRKIVKYEPSNGQNITIQVAAVPSSAQDQLEQLRLRYNLQQQQQQQGVFGVGAGARPYMVPQMLPMQPGAMNNGVRPPLQPPPGADAAGKQAFYQNQFVAIAQLQALQRQHVMQMMAQQQQQTQMQQQVQRPPPPQQQQNQQQTEKSLPPPPGV